MKGSNYQRYWQSCSKKVAQQELHCSSSCSIVWLQYKIPPCCWCNIASLTLINLIVSAHSTVSHLRNPTLHILDISNNEYAGSATFAGYIFPFLTTLNTEAAFVSFVWTEHIWVFGWQQLDSRAIIFPTSLAGSRLYLSSTATLNHRGPIKKHKCKYMNVKISEKENSLKVLIFLIR